MLERQATVAAELRKASSDFLDAFARMQQSQEAFDALGGAAVFQAGLYAAGNTQEITYAELYGAIVSTNYVRDFMAAGGHKINFYKVRG